MIIQPRMSARKWVDIAAGVFVRLRLADRLTVDPTECCGRCALATWPLPNRLEAFFSQGVIRDSGSIELDHVQRPQAAHRQIIAKSRGRCSAQSRAEGRAPRAISYRGAGKVRRRIRRLVRSRFFNNARTATRNLDLPLAIGDPHPRPSSSYCIGGFWPVHGGHNGRLFLASAGGFFIWAAIFGQGADMDFYGLEQPHHIRKPLNLLEDWCRKGGEPPTPSLRITGFRAKAVDPAGPARSPFSHAGR